MARRRLRLPKEMLAKRSPPSAAPLAAGETKGDERKMKDRSWKKALSLVLTFALVFAMPCVTSVWAVEKVDYVYGEWNKDTNTVEWKTGTAVNCTKITADNQQWGNTKSEEYWYVAEGDVTISSGVNVTGSVHLILADGCDLTINGGIVVPNGSSLTIYGQTPYGEVDGNTGKLTVAGGTGNAGIGSSSSDDVTITIHGGKVTAAGGTNGHGISGAQITISGGTFKQIRPSSDTPSLGYLPDAPREPEYATFLSDTYGDLTVSGRYQFRITSLDGSTPVMSVSNGNFAVSLARQSGNEYFYVLTCTGEPGSMAIVYMNGVFFLTATVGDTFSGVVSDTNAPFTVSQGGSYQFRLTAAEKPTMAAGSPSFTVAYVGNEGKDWFFKVTAIGKVGDGCGFYVNGQKDPVAIAHIA